MRVLLAAIRCGKGEVEQNLASHVRLVAEAAHDGCDLVLFPEMSLTGSVDPASHPERLMAADDAAVGRLARAADEAKVAVCFGIAERAADGRPYITQLFVDGGRVTGVQRKRHLGQGEESFTAASGNVTFECAGTRVGVAICAEAGFDGPFDAAAAAGGRLMLFRQLRDCTGGAPTRRPGRLASPGGRDAVSVTPPGTPAASGCGSPWRARPARPSTRTSRASRRWSARTGV